MSGQKLGIHEPLSYEPPTQKDLDVSGKLEAVLRGHNLFEPESESRKREEVLGKLYAIATDWVKQCSLEKAIDPVNPRECQSSLPQSAEQKYSLLVLIA